MFKITFPDNSVKEYDSPKSVLEIASSISKGLAKETLCATVNGEVSDIRRVIDFDARITFHKFEDPEGKAAFWHTTSHLMAQAIKHLYPNTQFAIGPAVDNGFYYDIDLDTAITPESLADIENEMRKIVKENPEIKRYTLPRDEAIAYEKKNGQDYKVQLIGDVPEGEEISFYSQGDYTDLCAGPHIASLSMIKAFKLTSIAGAYWRGDEKNKMLQRIYGVSFPSKKELDDYLKFLEEAKRRDHRRIGQELDLFSVMEEGPGFPFFHPKGMIIRNELENFWRQLHRQRGYVEVKTPMIMEAELWKRSGHWDHYKDNMYFTKIDDRDFAIKPMNCPGGILLYNRTMHSYKELPIRAGELGLVHRHEPSGSLHGLMRVRCFTQDDAHLFITEEMITDEIIGIIDLIDYVYKLFGFEYFVELSTMPEDHIGSDEDWARATQGLIDALDRKHMSYKVNEGDGAFYGPKIDFHLRDCIGRTWQCGTIQLDFQMPERFDCTYIGPDGAKHRPIMLHRVVFGSIERFIGILTEHFAGAFPLWLSPVQAEVISVGESFNNYAGKVNKYLLDRDIRSELDDSNEKLGYKVRQATLQKVPYQFVVGAKEQENGTVTVRGREGDLGEMKLSDACKLLKKEISTKSLEPLIKKAE
ncbi:MAG: threonine--tRNA ligase [Eubacteriaceae bacterium]|nr:threonine--tRNA ligase [Eubacteriaceae bacterium]